MEFRIGRHNSNLEEVHLTSRACQACHLRKVRCDLSATRRRCTNCRREPGRQCRPWTRRKKRTPNDYAGGTEREGQYSSHEKATADSRRRKSTEHAKSKSLLVDADLGANNEKSTDSLVDVGEATSNEKSTDSPVDVGDAAVPTSYLNNNESRLSRTRRGLPMPVRPTESDIHPQDEGEYNAQARPFDTLSIPDPPVTEQSDPFPVSAPHLTNPGVDIPISIPTPTATPYNTDYTQQPQYIAPVTQTYHPTDATINQDYPSSFSPDIYAKICDIQNTSALPGHTTRETLFENFWTYCYPWDPVLERSHLVAVTMAESSPILVNAILLAGSRMSPVSPPSSSPEPPASSHDFYNRAKTLFYLDLERDPLNLLMAVSLLHWFDPHGSAGVTSSNTATFWIRAAVGLAQQMGFHRQKTAVPDEGLRRRIFWALVARDCLVNAAHGRPMAINLADCDVPRPTIENFPVSPATGLIFIAYVDLAVIIGQFVKAAPNTDSPLGTSGIQKSLEQWIRTLPQPLKLSHSGDGQGELFKPPKFEARQLHILYYVAVVLIYRERTTLGGPFSAMAVMGRESTLHAPFSAAAVLASSTIAGIVADFIARDEVQFLNPLFTFYLLVATIPLLSCYKYAGAWAVAQEDLRVIARALDNMKLKWPSAQGSIDTFQKLYQVTVTTQRQVALLPVSACMLTAEQACLLVDVDTALCRMWDVLVRQDTEGQLDPASDRYEGGHDDSHSQSWQPGFHTAVEEHTSHSAFPGMMRGDDLNLDVMAQQEAAQTNGGMGEWLF